MPAQQKPSPFLSLPIELQTRILQEAADLQSLKNAAHSCSSWHNAYTESREILLTAVLERQCKAWFDDLHLATQARQVSALLEIDESQGKTDASAMLQQYRERLHVSWRISAEYHTPSTPVLIPYDEILEMLALRRCALHLLETMCGAFTDRLQNAGVTGTEVPIMPTGEEQVRLCRAICRWETFCCIFSQGWLSSRHQRAGDEAKSSCFTVDEVVELFFQMFLPWELEEMACVFDFLKSQYGQIFKEIVEHVLKEKPKHPAYARWDATPDWFEEFDIRQGTDGYESGREYLAELGLSFYDKICRAEDCITRHAIIERCIDYVNWEQGFHGIMLNRIEEYYIDSTYPPPEYTWRKYNEKRELAWHDRPSAGWVWLREYLRDTELGLGENTNLDIPLFAQTEERLWGYVFWDDIRLRKMGAYDQDGNQIFRPAAQSMWLNV